MIFATGLYSKVEGELPMINEKSGIVEFKSQKVINAERRKRDEERYRELQKRVKEILLKNYIK